MMEINICFSSSNEYSQHLGVAIASILKNANKTDELNFFVLDGGIEDDNKSKILSLKTIKPFNIEFLKIDYDNYKGMHIEDNNYVTIVSYFRYSIANLLSNIDKVLYLDCDLIIRESLEELYSTDINDYWIAGVEDIGYYSHRRFLNRETESFYINTGVILMNLAKWREDNIAQQLFDFTFKNGDILVHQDQDVINMVLNEKSKPLDLKWNVQDLCFQKNTWRKHVLGKEIKQAAKNPSIIHYTGPKKPWQNPLLVPASNFYLEYLRYTSWKKSMPSDFRIFAVGVKSSIETIIQKPFLIFSKKFISANWKNKLTILVSSSTFFE